MQTNLTFSSLAVIAYCLKPARKQLLMQLQTLSNVPAIDLHHGSGQSRTQGGLQGMHPPTRPKEVLTRHLISLKIIAKNIFVLHTKN